MSKVSKQEGEDIQKIAEEIIHLGLRLPEVLVVRAMCLPASDTKKKVLKIKIWLGERLMNIRMYGGDRLNLM